MIDTAGNRPNIARRDKIAVLAALASITVLAWIYLVSMASSMADMKPMMIPEWTAGYFLMMFIMWAVMMVGMMVPTVTPTVLIYAAVARKSADQGTPVAPASAFVAGYITIWTAFSLLATTAQFGLDKAALLSPMMVSNSPRLGAALLVAAGVYQLLPIKNRCLKNCRSPVDFIATYWRKGAAGAFTMGAHHGIYCLGCCWVLMLLLFVGGVMNLLWIALITVFVLLEKVLPFGDRGGKAFGVLMIAAGILFWFRAG